MDKLKPVAWICTFKGSIATHIETTADKYVADKFESEGFKVTPLYALPEGYAIVPVEPSVKMIRRAVFTELGTYAQSNLSEAFTLISDMYEAMLKAAQEEG